jgi:DNA-binding winged helix-turn-helix (wHTH) protein
LKILDFGLAKLLHPSDDAGLQAETVVGATEPGRAMGTTGYMSPEQIRDEELDERCDIFALGAIVYELLSQRPAFAGRNSSDIMASVLRDDPPALAAVGAAVPAGVQTLVARCLEKRRADRFGSARELAVALETLLQALGPMAAKSSDAELGLPPLVQLGDCLFDRAARRLTRAGKAVKLTPRAVLLLQLLLERHPRPVSRQELHELLWRRAPVSRTALPRLLAELRTALGDRTRSPKLVRAVRRLGYAVAEPASVPWPPVPIQRSGGSLVPVGDATRLGPAQVAVVSVDPRSIEASDLIALAQGENLIGRGAQCGVRLDRPRISRVHARILVAGGRVVIEDLASKNGTFVNGRRIARPVRLAPGDQICLGTFVLFFSSDGDSEATPTTTGLARRMRG